jgi:hypothetical protein
MPGEDKQEAKGRALNTFDALKGKCGGGRRHHLSEGG